MARLGTNRTLLDLLSKLGSEGDVDVVEVMVRPAWAHQVKRKALAVRIDGPAKLDPSGSLDTGLKRLTEQTRRACRCVLATVAFTIHEVRLAAVDAVNGNRLRALVPKGQMHSQTA